MGIPAAYILGVYYGLSNPGLWLGITLGNGLLAILYSQLAWSHDWEISADECSKLIESYIDMSRRSEFEDQKPSWGNA